MAQNVDAGTISVKLKADITKYQEAIRSTMASVEKWGLKNERTYKNADGTVREHTKRYKDNLKKQSDANKDLASSTERSQQSLRNYFAATQNFLQKINISETIKGLARAFSSHELVVHRLTTQLSLNRRNVESVSADYNNFANSLEAVTTQSRSTILNMLRQAEVFGLTGTTAKRAVENALALADQNDMSAESALQLTLALQRGNSEGLEPYIEELRYMTSEGARFNYASQEMQRMFVGMTQRASGMTGEIQKLQVVYEELKIELGEPIAKAFTPLLRTFRRMVETFRNMSPAMKENIVAALSFAGALVSIGPAMTFITPLFGIMSGPLIPALRIASRLILSMVSGFSLINVVMLVAIPVIVSLISRVEGFSQVWNYVKESAISFWNATKPILVQLGNIAVVIFRSIIHVLTLVGDTILWALGAVFGEIDFSWMDFRDMVLEALIFIEYSLINWRDVWNLVLTFIKLKAIETFNGMLRFFYQTIPNGILYLWNNGREIFKRFFNYIKDLLLSLARRVYDTFANIGSSIMDWLRDPLQGFSLSIDWNQLGSSLSTQAQSFTQTYLVDPIIAALDMEDRIRAEFDSIASIVDTNYQEFRATRMAQLLEQRQLEDRDRTHRQQEIQREHRWTVSQYESLNATLLGSTEALDRILKYRENSLGARLPSRNERGEGGANNLGADNTLGNAISDTFANFSSTLGSTIRSIEQNLQTDENGNIPGVSGLIDSINSGLMSSIFMGPVQQPALNNSLGQTLLQQTPLVGDLLGAINQNMNQSNQLLQGILLATQEGALLEGADLD